MLGKLCVSEWVSESVSERERERGSKPTWREKCQTLLAYSKQTFPLFLLFSVFSFFLSSFLADRHVWRRSPPSLSIALLSFESPSCLLHSPSPSHLTLSSCLLFFFNGHSPRLWSPHLGGPCLPALVGANCSSGYTVLKMAMQRRHFCRFSAESVVGSSFLAVILALAALPFVRGATDPADGKKFLSLSLFPRPFL